MWARTFISTNRVGACQLMTGTQPSLIGTRRSLSSTGTTWNLSNSVPLPDTTLHWPGQIQTRSGAAPRPTRTVSGSPLSTPVTTDPAATSSADRCTRPGLPAPPVLRGHPAPPPTPASAPPPLHSPPTPPLPLAPNLSPPKRTQSSYLPPKQPHDLRNRAQQQKRQENPQEEPQ